MTSSNGNNSDRLQQITENLASITTVLATLSHEVRENRERILRLEKFSSENAARLERLDRLAEGLVINVQNQNETQRSVLETQVILTRTTEQRQEQLINNHERLIQQQERIVLQQEKLIQHQAETRAAIAKIDRVLDYLLKRDSDR
jgi:hypothetical protein